MVFKNFISTILHKGPYLVCLNEYLSIKFTCWNISGNFYKTYIKPDVSSILHSVLIHKCEPHRRQQKLSVLFSQIIIKDMVFFYFFLVKINMICGRTFQCSLFIFLEGDNFKLIVGLGVGISLFVLAVLIGTIIAYFVREKPRPVVSSNIDYIENTYSEGEMYFVMGRLTKVDSLGRYGSQYSHWSGHSGERGRDDFDDVSRTRESCSTHVYNTID